ncbi:hypothetical protein D3C78_1146380 [compost metagenome]
MERNACAGLVAPAQHQPPVHGSQCVQPVGGGLAFPSCDGVGKADALGIRVIRRGAGIFLGLHRTRGGDRAAPASLGAVDGRVDAGVVLRNVVAAGAAASADFIGQGRAFVVDLADDFAKGLGQVFGFGDGVVTPAAVDGGMP